MIDWLLTHWFELATVTLLGIIAVNTIGNDWNLALAVKRLDLMIHLLGRIEHRLSEDR
jgi:hypothetical protein